MFGLDDALIGSIVGGGIGAIGNIINGKRQERANDNNLEAQERANQANRDLQYDFAKNGIKWRVQDAIDAGLHPLVGAGATPSMGQASYVGGVDNGSDGKGNALASMGQSLERAMMSTATRKERQQALMRQKVLDNLNLERHKLDVQNMELQNALLASRIGRLRSAQISPGGMPSSVDGSSNVVVKPDEMIALRNNDSSLTAAPPKAGFTQITAKDLFGNPQVYDVPTQEWQDFASEDMMGHWLVWRQNLGNWINSSSNPGSWIPYLPDYFAEKWNKYKKFRSKQGPRKGSQSE